MSIWSEEDIEELKLGVSIGLSTVEISGILDRSYASINSKARRLNLSVKKSERYWSEKKIDILMSSDSAEEVSKLLNDSRSLKSIHYKATKLNKTFSVQSKRYWTEQETKILLDNYQEKGPFFCSRLLGRASSSCTKKALKMGLRIVHWEDHELEFLKNNYQEEGATFCAEALNKTFSSVTHKAERMHLLSSAKGAGNPDSPTYLYIVRILEEPDLYKVGITDNLNRRLKEFGSEVLVCHMMEYPNRKPAYHREQEILKILKRNKYLENTGILLSGNTETFRVSKKELKELELYEY